MGNILETGVRLIILLGILIFVHELGHFIFAKLVGIRVERFSLGFPPRMIGKKIGDTDYCISWIPLGGYVKMSGMIDESLDKDSIKGEPWEFMSKPIYQRLLVILAGPLMNILLFTVLISAVIYFKGEEVLLGVSVGEIKSKAIMTETGLQPGDMILSINDRQVKTWSEVDAFADSVDRISVIVSRENQLDTTIFLSTLLDSIMRTRPPIVGRIDKKSPALKAGLQPGDRIVAINDHVIRTWDDMTEVIHANPEHELTIKWERNGQILIAGVEPRRKKVLNPATMEHVEIGLIGIEPPYIQIKEYNLLQSIGFGVKSTWYSTIALGYALKLVISGEVQFKNAFAGPIGIAKIVDESARRGIYDLISLFAFISLNLGLLNLLPIPVLDGGHIVFLVIEAIIRRPISPKVKLVIQQIGMALIIALMLFVIINDFRR